ncbi:15-hydroxyprostaglandin dehydrogenase [Trichonephila clavipes]|nr:15-hydroxyprostaglandin dehydrogenase [Trichonephila clavipes]
MPPHGPALSSLDTLCCPEADGPTNLEKSTLNHVQNDTMASAVFADLTRAPQGTNRVSWSVRKVSEIDVGSLEQLLLYADGHYLAGKLPLGDHLGKPGQAVDGSAELSCFVPTDELSSFLLLSCFVPAAGGRRKCKVELFRSCCRVELFSPVELFRSCCRAELFFSCIGFDFRVEGAS